MGVKWMEKDVTTATVYRRPVCDICSQEAKRLKEHELPVPQVELAQYDAKTVFGPWAYLCERHFDRFGISLGTGYGQKLIVKGEVA